MDLSKLNILQKVILAIEDVSLLYKQGSKLSLSVGADFLVNVSMEKLKLALEELQDEYVLIKLEEVSCQDHDNIFFSITSHNGIDYWANKIRHDELEPVGEIKIWGKLKISMERSWLRFDDDPKIKINIANKTIQFLIELIDARGEIIEYDDLAKKINLSVGYIGANISGVRDSLKATKRDLGAYLKKSGLSEYSTKQITNMIRAIRSKGYCLVLK